MGQWVFIYLYNLRRPSDYEPLPLYTTCILHRGVIHIKMLKSWLSILLIYNYIKQQVNALQILVLDAPKLTKPR